MTIFILKILNVMVIINNIKNLLMSYGEKNSPNYYWHFYQRLVYSRNMAPLLKWFIGEANRYLNLGRSGFLDSYHFDYSQDHFDSIDFNFRNILNRYLW